jgi:Tfp pilus assembly protein PilN
MIKINLLSEGKKPAAVRRTKSAPGPKSFREDIATWAFAGSLLLVLAGLGIYGWMLWSELAAKEKQIKEAKIEVNKLAAIIREVDDYKKKKADLEHKIRIITELKANQRGPVQVMDEVSRGLPELLWLTGLEMNNNTLRLRGKTFNMTAVATLIDNLDRVPEFQEPELLDSKREGEVYDFSLQVAYKPVPVTVPGTGDAASEAVAPASATKVGG